MHPLAVFDLPCRPGPGVNKAESDFNSREIANRVYSTAWFHSAEKQGRRGARGGGGETNDALALSQCPPTHQLQGMEQLVCVFGRCEKEKTGFQNVLKFWQMPPKCEDWRRFSRTIVTQSCVAPRRSAVTVRVSGRRKNFFTFLPTLPQQPTKVQGALRKQNHQKRFMQRKHFLD